MIKFMKKILIPASLTLLLLTPSLAFAALGGVQNFLASIQGLVNTATIIVVAIALLVFFWGLTKLIAGGGEAIAEGKTLMIWGVVALFVMVSVWGLVYFIQDNLLGSGANYNAPPIPTFGAKTSSGGIVPSIPTSGLPSTLPGKNIPISNPFGSSGSSDDGDDTSNR
jgi:hypothetical protein